MKINIRSVFFAIAALILISEPQAAVQDMPALVAKPYPGAVPEDTEDEKHLPCGSSYCFLTHDPAEKVMAFYAKDGIKLKPMANELPTGYNEWPITQYVAPLEYYPPVMATDLHHFSVVTVMFRGQKAPLKGDGEGRQAVIDDEVLGSCCALSPVSKLMVPLYGNIFLEPDQLIPLYNRHMAILSGYFRKVRGQSVAKLKYLEMHPTWSMPAGFGVRSEKDTRQEEMRKELKEILARKPEKKREYNSLKRGIRDKETRNEIQPELDKILMSDPELAAWKKRSDALEQQSKESGAKGSAQDIRTLRTEDVEAYLKAIEKEAYHTRIHIDIAGGARVTRDPAKVQREWQARGQHRSGP